MFDLFCCQCKVMKILFFLAAGFACLIVYVRFLEATAIFLPTRVILANPKGIGLSYEDVYFKAADQVQVHAWLVPAQGALSTIVIFHGNAGNIGDRLGKIEMFHRMGLNVFIMDYRGYGLSQGRPTERGIYRDALASYDYLRQRKDYAPTRIIAYGDSLGGSAAVELASQRPVAALILESTFTSGADMAKKIAPFIPAFLLHVKFDNLSKIKTVSVPKLFIHSSDDEMIPYQFGIRLYNAASAPKAFIKISGTHNEGSITSGNYYVSGIRDFLVKNKFIK